jgi:hypothetical protein
MLGLKDDDDDRVAKIRNNIRVEERFAWSGLIAFAFIAMLFLGILEFHLPRESTGMAAFAVFLAWVVFVFRGQTTMQHIAGLQDEETLRRTIDDQHRRWRWIYIFIFILVGCLAAMITGSVLLPAAHPLARPGSMAGMLVTVVDLACFAIVAALQVCFGPGFLRGTHRRALNDEHTRALQQSAALFGYLLCVILMCAVLVVMALRPQWGLVIMPGIIAVAVISPGLYFLIRQWRAGRDG